VRSRRIHADEIDTDTGLVRRLVASQLPQWAELPIRPVDSAGTVNALYRLGHDMVVRLPRRAPQDIDREHGNLTRVAPHLPVAVPVPLAKGKPAGRYPWDWCVDRWIEGEHPVAGDLEDPERLARDLADLVKAVWRIDPAGAPVADRGVPLARFDPSVRKALPQLSGTIDTVAAATLWERLLGTPEWSQPPVWVHGDLIPFNLLMRDGRLGAVLDWGSAGLGDPATDLQPAWTVLPRGARALFRQEVGVDDATWERGRGWALWTGIVGFPYYQDTNPLFAANSLYRLRAVLGDGA
jgi:aminoglycoside phosphotransferase (APT) family kinase protein